MHDNALQPDPRLTGHMPGLDGLRGYAALLIVVYHYTSWVWASHFGDPMPEGIKSVIALRQYGWLGVDVFFVLSGFLITGILIKTRDHPRYFRYFYARRALRIFPLYYLALLGALIIAPMLLTVGPGEQETLDNQAWLWLYGTNFRLAFGPEHIFGEGWMSLRHFWSLAVEEHFYLVWPLLVFLTPARRLGGVCLAMVGVGVASRLACYAWFDPEKVGIVVRAITPCHVDKLALGGLLAYGLHQRVVSLDRLRPWAMASVVVLLAFLSVCGLRGVRHESFLMQNVGYPLITLASAGAIVLALSAAPGSVISRLLTNRVAVLLGLYSYGMYVWHNIPRYWLGNKGMGPRISDAIGAGPTVGFIASAAVATLGTILVSAASYHGFEAWFLKLKKHVGYHAPTSPASGETASGYPEQSSESS